MCFVEINKEYFRKEANIIMGIIYRLLDIGEKLFFSGQYDLKRLQSSHMALIMEKLISSSDKSETVIRIFLDLSIAFDTVDHEILLQNLFILWHQRVCLGLV